jgi:hypothetical protein
MNAPVHANAIDVSKITFQVGKAVAKRSPPISIRYNGTQLQIRLPRLACPFGLRENSNDTGVKTYKLATVLKGCDPYCKEKYVGDDEVGKLGNFLMELDEHIKNAAIANSTQWFGKKRSDNSIVEAYASNLYPSIDVREGERIPNGKYPPTFRIKVPVYDGRVSAEFVDASRNHVYVTPESLGSILPKGIESNMILTPSIYVINGATFGVTWRLKAAQLFPVPQITAAMMFDDESNAPPSKGLADADVDNDDGEYGGGALHEESAPPTQTVVEEVAPSAGAGGPAPPAPTGARKRRAVASSAPL